MIRSQPTTSDAIACLLLALAGGYVIAVLAFG